MPTMDTETSPVSDAYNQIASFLSKIARRFVRNFKASFTEVDAARWKKVILIVVVYILIRPYIDKFFRYMHDRDRAKERAKKKAKEEEEEREVLRARISANQLRGVRPSSAGEGKVLGEIESDEEVEIDDADDEAKASGVPEFGKLARKRQKKYWKNVQKGQQQRAEELTDSRMLELLDWSESEEDEKKKGSS